MYTKLVQYACSYLPTREQVRTFREDEWTMFPLGLQESLSVESRVDSIETVPYNDRGDALNVTVTVRFFDGNEVQLVLWASPDAAEDLEVENEFVRREINLEGYGPHDLANPYERGRVMLSAIWFDDPDGEMIQKRPLQVLREVFIP